MTSRRRILAAAKFLVSGTLLVVLYSRIDAGALAARIRNIDPLLLALVFGILFFNTLISSLKWKVLLDADGIDLPLGTLFHSYLIGTFFNVFLPSNIGGDAYRVVDVSRQSARPVHTFASVFVDRLSGFSALAIMGFVFGAAGRWLLESDRVLWLPLVLFGAILAAAWMLYRQTPVIRLMRVTRLDRIRPLAGLVDGFLSSVAAYKRRRGVVTRIMGISFAFQFAVIVCVYTLARAIDIEAPFVLFCVFVPLISLLEALPVSIYGLGLRDAGYVFFFSRLNRPDEQALSLALLYVTVSLVYASCGGIVFALRRGRGGRHA